MKRILAAVTMTLAAALSGPAVATADGEGWIEARTDHFIIYVQDDEARARTFAARLEQFDDALRALYDVADDPARRSNPLRIFALRKNLYLDVCSCYGAVGYYQARAGGSAIFTLYDPSVDAKAKPGSLTSESVLLHEYGHHFMFSNFPMAYPTWYSEGFAEFNANVLYNADGSLTLGLPANYRTDAIRAGAINMSVTEFLQPTATTRQNGGETAVLYGKGWLLTHYLMLDAARRKQLSVYLDGLNHGKTSIDSAKAAFGDLRELWKALSAYGRGRLSPPLRIPAPARPVEVRLTRLSRGAGEMMLPYGSVTSGRIARVLPGIARDAEKIGARYPADPLVQAELAEIEYAAKRNDEADAAADRALTADPANMTAMLIKGRVAVRRAEEARATEPKVWSAARAWFLKANRVDQNAALPLLLYYRSFKAAKQAPTPNAVNALSRAAVLAPEDSGVRWLLAERMLADGNGVAARALLQPIAFAPHDRRPDARARKAVDLIDTGKVEEAKAALSAVKKGEDDDED